ncbi:hypothetical protein GO495_02960 [Chitinophaga oryziterrae]|uniref:Mannosyltransferase n=1 Tax=Chitinophaga oryziterrae TaxID=1031224 RepID=A0A6N8J2S2_9BACT|nr:hypothetical protein [Chitinophaga oryziterrae]MVT39535.1 hypothetical protein [Chitinophaga oryziterrae]
MNTVQRRTLYFIIAAIIYYITAFNATGYYNPDEHFQIFEFAALKIPGNGIERMPWEHLEMMRSSFQPWIAYCLIVVCRSFHVSDPYLITLILRVFTATLSLTAIALFFNRYKSVFKGKWADVFLLLFLFLWFLPYINVRFNSESWSGIFILLGVSLIPPDREMKHLNIVGCGLLCGISFLCRFQCGIIVLSLSIWLVLNKIKPGYIFIFYLPFLLIIAGGTFLDKLYYNQWTFAPWNYVRANIINDVASQFGTTFWLLYVKDIVYASVIPVGIFVIIFYILYAAVYPGAMFLWITLPFVLIHLLIPHKELRFIFPILNLLPFIIVRGMEAVERIYRSFIHHYRKPLITVGSALLMLNLTALIVMTYTPPSGGRIGITQFVYDNYRNKNIRLFHLGMEEENPYEPFSFLSQSFYYNPHIKSIILNDSSVTSLNGNVPDSLTFIVLRGQTGRRFIDNKNVRLIRRGYPLIAEKIVGWYSNEMNMGEYFLYEKKD